MTRITNSDQVLLLLRSYLQRAQRSERKEKSSSAPVDATPGTPLERVQQLARQDDLPPKEIARALVGGLLTNEFGGAISNGADFQAIVDDVLDVIQRDQITAQLLDRSIRQLVEGN